MAKKTDYLELVLPELNEFINSWNGPVNQNMESIDDFCSDLYESLVGTSATATWSSLRGTHGSLADRLDVSLNPDGTLDLSSSPGLTEIGVSAYHGKFDTPVKRLNDTDGRIHESGTPQPLDRFIPTVPPAATSTVHGALDDGIALRTRDFSTGLGAVPMPWTPGLMTGGDSPLLSGSGTPGVVQINVSGPPAVFNIDGYVFRIRETIQLDYSALPGLAPLDYVWIYVDRNESAYADTTFKFKSTGAGTFAHKDLRKLKLGTGGAVSNPLSVGTFVAPSGSNLNVALGAVSPDDILVIEGTGPAAGEYAINALGSPADTTLTIKGLFPSSPGGLTWHVLDKWHPGIGAARVALSTDAPPIVPGRVYIGRVQHQAALPPAPCVSWQRGGVFDSGWTLADSLDPGPGTMGFSHNLGSIPSSVEVWVRAGATGEAHRPLVQRTVVTDTAGPDTAILMFPSVRIRSSETTVSVHLPLNSTTSPLKAQALFTDSTGTDRTATGNYIRVIAKR